MQNMKIMQNMASQTYQTEHDKSNIQNLSNQTYQTKPSKQNLPN